MRIPRFWIKAACPGSARDGKAIKVEAWGWSCDTLVEAEQVAIRRARQALERVLKFGTEEKAGQYDYLDMPLREEVLQELGPESQPFAAVTRNRYGCLVLNTGSVLFADIDFPKPKARGFFDFFRLLFSEAFRADRAEETRQATLSEVKTWIAAHPQRAVRVYRTAAGLRLLFTDRTYLPAGEESLGLLRELGSDSLYIRLTQKQESFRARLTPKPWRCGQANCDIPFPYKDHTEEDKAKAWQQAYEQKSAGYRVCDLISTSGKDASDPAIKAVIDLHDRYACQPRAGRLA